jgi:hypothetical protein
VVEVAEAAPVVEEIVEVTAEVAAPARKKSAAAPKAKPRAKKVAAPAVVTAPAEEVAPAEETAPTAEAAPVAVVEVAAEAEAAVETARPGKPAFTPGRPVTAYSAEELTSVVAWIDSDGVKRSEDELLRAAMKELGFARLGPRIKDALGAAIAAARS